MLEKGETNDVLRAVFAAFARHRPSVICSRDPGLLSLLRKTRYGNQWTTLEDDALDKVVKIKDEYVPLVLLLNRYFEDKARSLIDDEKQTKEPEQTVVFDSTYADTDNAAQILERAYCTYVVVVTRRTLHWLVMNVRIHSIVVCVVHWTRGKLHSDECESFGEHQDNALEVDLKSGGVL